MKAVMAAFHYSTITHQIAGNKLAVGPQITIAKILVNLIWRFSKGSPYVYMYTEQVRNIDLAVA